MHPGEELMKNLLILSLILAASLNSLAKEKTSVEYWNETEISEKNLTFFVNQSKCYAKKEALVGCFNAVNSLASSTVTAVAANAEVKNKNTTLTRYLFAPKSYVQTLPADEVKVLSNYGDLVLVFQMRNLEKNKKQTPVQAYKAIKKEVAEYNRAISQLLSTPNKIKFDELALELVSKQSKKDELKINLARAINAYLENAYDPHTSLLSFDQFVEEYKDRKPFFGIGVEITEENKRPFIQDVMDASPAQKAGLQAGDIITHVDGKPTESLTIDQTIDMIKGEENTQVKITVLRESKSIDHVITRGKVNVSVVKFAGYSDFGIRTAYVKLNVFVNDSCRLVQKGILDAASKFFILPEALIFDLRNNPGGGLDEAICIGQIFAGIRPIVSVKNLITGQVEPNIDSRKPSLPPMGGPTVVVLINSGSASASEVVAGALQDYKAAWILGERSFGKGTVQQVYPEKQLVSRRFFDRNFNSVYQEIQPPKGTAIKKTIQRFYSPRGVSNQLIGITPDLVVPARPGMTDEEREGFREENISDVVVSNDNAKRELLRANEINYLQENCLNRKRAEAVYEERSKLKQKADYQLLKAQELLACVKEAIKN